MGDTTNYFIHIRSNVDDVYVSYRTILLIPDKCIKKFIYKMDIFVGKKSNYNNRRDDEFFMWENVFNGIYEIAGDKLTPDYPSWEFTDPRIV